MGLFQNYQIPSSARPIFFLSLPPSQLSQRPSFFFAVGRSSSSYRAPMASSCGRFACRTTASAFKSATRSAAKTASAPKCAASSSTFKANSSPPPRFSFSRVPSELGCVQSLLPLHSAVAVARMTSCLSTTSQNCRSLLQGTLCRTSPSL